SCPLCLGFLFCRCRPVSPLGVLGRRRPTSAPLLVSHSHPSVPQKRPSRVVGSGSILPIQAQDYAMPPLEIRSVPIGTTPRGPGSTTPAVQALLANTPGELLVASLENSAATSPVPLQGEIPV